MTYSLALHRDHVGKGWLLELLAERSRDGQRLADDFEVAVFLHLDPSTRWFLQGSGDTWKMVEFWITDQATILSTALEFAARMNLDLFVGHGRDPRLNELLARPQ